MSIDSDQQKVTVSGSVDSEILIKKLVKAGKHAEIWSNKSNNNQSQSQNQKGCMKDDKKNKGLESLEKQQKIQTLTSGEDDDDSFANDEDVKLPKEKSSQPGFTSANNPRNAKNKSEPNNGNGKKGQNEGGQKGNFVDLNEGKRVNDLTTKMNNLGGGGGNLGGFEMANGGQHVMMNMNGSRYNQQQQQKQQGYNHQQQQGINQSAASGASLMMNMQNMQAMYQRPSIMPPTTSYYHNYNPAPYPYPYNEPAHHGYYYTGMNGGGDDNMLYDDNTSSCSIM